MTKVFEKQVAELNLDRSDWQQVKFGDVAIQQKQTVDRDKTELTRYVKGEHMYSEDLHLRKWGELTDEYLGPAFIRKFEEGDILYGSRRTYLRKVVMAPFAGITSNTTFVIKANEEEIDKRLLPFIMMSEGFAQHSIRNSKGSVNPYVNWKDLANYEFLLPSKKLQIELCDLLWPLDNTLESGLIAGDKLRVLLLSIREIDLASKKHKRITLDKILTDIVPGKSLNGSNTPVSGNEKGVLKISAVGPNGFDSKENKRLNNQEGFLSKFQVKNGDVLITRANTTELVGRVCFIDQDFPNLMLCDKTLKLALDTKKINPVFLVEILNGSESRRQIESYATGTGGAMKNITQNEIRSIKIPFPVKSIQDEMAKKVNEIKNNISKQRLQNECLKSLRSSLLNQVF